MIVDWIRWIGPACLFDSGIISPICFRENQTKSIKPAMIRRQGHDARSKFASRTWPSRETRRVFCGFCRGFCRCCGDRDAANILYYYREWNVMMNQRSWCDCTIWWWRWGGGSFGRCGSESASTGVVHSPSTTTMTPSGCVSAAPELEWKPASVVGMRSTNAYSCNWCTREARFQQTLEVLAFRAFSCIYLVKCVFIKLTCWCGTWWNHSDPDSPCVMRCNNAWPKITEFNLKENHIICKYWNLCTVINQYARVELFALIAFAIFSAKVWELWLQSSQRTRRENRVRTTNNLVAEECGLACTDDGFYFFRSRNLSSWFNDWTSNWYDFVEFCGIFFCRIFQRQDYGKASILMAFAGQWLGMTSRCRVRRLTTLNSSSKLELDQKDSRMRTWSKDIDRFWTVSDVFESLCTFWRGAIVLVLAFERFGLSFCGVSSQTFGIFQLWLALIFVVVSLDVIRLKNCEVGSFSFKFQTCSLGKTCVVHWFFQGSRDTYSEKSRARHQSV